MTAITNGVHHIGLTVARLEDSANFFTQRLGWQEVNRNPDYPAIFVSDGSIMVTLWQTQTDSPEDFDKNTQVGLHHVAFQVNNETDLDRLHESFIEAEDVTIEFAPELLRQGPAKHMMVYEPSGIRVEFIWLGN
jgi:catechol 2,3-dioxygenase-like lactoylglutathione lyase family enzyme